MPFLRARSVAASLLLLVSVAGCSTMSSWFDSDKGGKIDQRPAEEIYAEAMSLLEGSSYPKAVGLFEQLEAKYPYGRYAQQAQLNIAYAWYKAQEPAQALAAVERFIKLHPNHANVDYAYYLKGLITFNDDEGVMGVIAMQDLSERDPRAMLDSFDSFKELVTRFPNSKYAEDARVRMAYLVNAIAKHEIYVARYYQKRSAYLAAANRAQTTIKNFPNSPSVEEALAIMIYSYDQLNMKDLADDTRRVLVLNYPQSPYNKDPSPAKRPWWRIW
ncbi:outer membrane protein assembly factor BamD [Niveibacterium sp. 24ML]|uniref:outer membrane protein assembly factor BamD n=1 Tax=Niveibacterium sp. 24ML TaxID=2985512 RepID=UPI00226FF736|nr:outer membrane protein assembly factor BamD [Niveibacterium sp. 24ML]MCX9157008.1 outer membrane protein assembly factor BamD [Niveibacterium sp. 24ML]